MSPKRLFSILAIAEAITWTMLIIGMVLKYGTQTTELGVRIGGGVHGFVFLAYCVVTVLVATSERWGKARGLLGLGSAIIPYATIPFEIWARRKGLLPESWSLGEQRQPANPFERLCLWALKNPVLAVIVGIVLVSALFAFLLFLGPPVPQS
ncbi:DUF3817 domain-containing protein [Brevibacterium sp. HMSC22B09]|uniref:DUF3817 domain-containing protein n=1 Tax=Brevibacterium sp. HMSC22B09 TaxID=1581055 RepID=UPI0008A143F8|nr:DUF3817 domain-containing protein [Brevibacterium sp. HMSC22B09]OFT97045.1 hypothetical protein HMPREF3087_06185 [Brevibacterium sp. HMSC22B09]